MCMLDFKVEPTTIGVNFDDISTRRGEGVDFEAFKFLEDWQYCRISLLPLKTTSETLKIDTHS